YSRVIPSEHQLESHFWIEYTEEQWFIGLHTSLLLWLHSGFKNLPWEFQLIATMATMTGEDSLVDIGTGAGKTLCMVLPCML
ncbi:hypothetical protein V8E53_004067, partial [Lactarius tabidus]